MNAGQWTALVPILIVAGASLIVLITAAFSRHPSGAAWLTCVGLGAALGAVCMMTGEGKSAVAFPLLAVDQMAQYFMGLIFIAAMGTVALAHGYLAHLGDRRGEFYVLLLLAVLGSGVMVSSIHFVSLFLGLELLSVSLYGMIAYVRADEHSLEAGMKYLILASISSAFLLFGIAMIYAELGTMEFSATASALIAHVVPQETTVLNAGIALLLAGIGFKLGIVPFHMWTPDVYEGAPAPVTAFLATVSKGAMAAALLRFMSGIRMPDYPGLLAAFAAGAVASMFVGNFLALKQHNVKRLLAYSSITHFGYVLIAFIGSGANMADAVMYYLGAYVVTSLLAFGIVSVCSTSRLQLNTIDEYRGLFWTRPGLGGMFTIALLSLAGMPLTAGFIGKYLVITTGAASAQWVILGILAINSAIGLYYYLRVVVAMYAQPAEMPGHLESMSIEGGIVLALLTIAVLWLGVYPSPLLGLIHAAASALPL